MGGQMFKEKGSGKKHAAYLHGGHYKASKSQRKEIRRREHAPKKATRIRVARY